MSVARSSIQSSDICGMRSGGSKFLERRVITGSWSAAIQSFCTAGGRVVSLWRCRRWFERGLCLIHILIEVHLHRRRHGARNVGVCGLPIPPTHSRCRRVFIQSCCCYCMACLVSCLLQCTLSQEVLVVIVEWGIAHFPVTADGSAARSHSSGRLRSLLPGKFVSGLLHAVGLLMSHSRSLGRLQLCNSSTFDDGKLLLLNRCRR